MFFSHEDRNVLRSSDVKLVLAVNSHSKSIVPILIWKQAIKLANKNHK